MQKQKFDEIVSYFNKKVSEMEIETKYKMELLGMVTALGCAHEKETHEKRTKTHACDCISRQAVEHLDWFTKLYCRDKSITDDLAFRCEQCEFEMPDGRCLVKAMARKLCPDYKDFGAMGDL